MTGKAFLSISREVRLDADGTPWTSQRDPVMQERIREVILVDSQQLESGEGMSVNFKKIAAVEIEEFKADYRLRFPGRSTDDLSDEDLLREVMNTGGDEPYEKLKRALRADIDEAAWSTLYSTVSRPFAPPETGNIAVKAINHYGDEVLKVYDVVKVLV